jgi:uncharacterized protein
MNHFPLARQFLQGSLISLVFIVLDAFWLKSLPKIDVSFGPAFTSFFIFSLFRILILFVWFFLVWVVSRSPAGWQRFLNFTWMLLAVPNLLVLGLGLYAFCIEPFELTVSRIEVPVPGLRYSQRIVQLSDLHVEFTTRRERELSDLVESLHPDLIVLTGDYANESYIDDPRAAHDLHELLDHFRAPLGIYAVNGNVENPLWMPLIFSHSNIRILENEIVHIPELGEHFVLVGLSYTNWQDDIAALNLLMGDLQPSDFTVLLYHKPDLAYAARDTGVNLYLAGHTHGGQVRLPLYGALFSNSRFGKTFEMGLYHLGDMTLYVSRGLGFTGGDAPRARFLSPPEVVVVDLVPEGDH